MNISIYRDGQQYGPYTLEQVQEYVSDGTLIPASDLAWHDGMTEWLPLNDVLSQLAPAVPSVLTVSSSPAPAPAVFLPAESNASKPEPLLKTFWVAFVLCLLLGFVGAHRFYLGKKSAWLMLVTFGFCGIWWLVDILLLLANQLTDTKKNPVINPKPAVTWPMVAVWLLIVFANGSHKSNNDLTNTNDSAKSDQQVSASAPTIIVDQMNIDIGDTDISSPDEMSVGNSVNTRDIMSTIYEAAKRNPLANTLKLTVHYFYKDHYGNKKSIDIPIVLESLENLRKYSDATTYSLNDEQDKGAISSTLSEGESKIPTNS
jgi:hypothetical protein